MRVTGHVLPPHPETGRRDIEMRIEIKDSDGKWLLCCSTVWTSDAPWSEVRAQLIEDANGQRISLNEAWNAFSNARDQAERLDGEG